MRALLAGWSLLGLLLAVTAANAQTTLTVSPTPTYQGGTVTAAWSGIPTPTAYDWLSLHNSATSSVTLAWRYTNGAASGSVPFTIPTGAAHGTTYELRLRQGSTVLATSNVFTIGPSVTGTVSVGGSPRAGVAFSANNGGTCTTSNSSGQYACAVPPGWSGTITPSLSGYVFSPPSRNYSNVSANQPTQNYVAATAIHQVSGTVTAGGAPLANVAFAATNGAAYAVTCTSSDASGQYSCSVMEGWSGTLTPSLSGYLFTPASRTYSNVTAHQSSQDYAGVVSYQINGVVMWGGSPLAGAALTATGGVACTSSNAAGQYTCSVPTGWSGSVTPSLNGYAFAPPSRAYNGVSAHQNAQDYAATAYYQLSGTVTAGGSALAGVSFAPTAGGSCVPSNASGQYTCTVPQGWSGTVTPSRNGYLFVPASLSHTNVLAHQTGHNYTATVVSGGTQIKYIHADHLNTPRLVADATGVTVWRWDQQEPFGVNVPDENPSGLGSFDLPVRLPGQYFDKETNLHYNYFRDYDPSVGRYGESDPIGLVGGLNTYAYVGGHALSYVDRFGLSWGGAWQSMKDLWAWTQGTLGNRSYGPNDAITQDLNGTPVMDEIRRKFKANNCKDGIYCGNFQYSEFFSTGSVVGQTVGSFCARLTPNGNAVSVIAENTWGLESGTRFPEFPGFGSNRRNASVQQMITGGASVAQWPKSLLENETSGHFANATTRYRWTERNPCCE